MSEIAYTPSARSVLQRMDANAASRLARKAERIFRMSDRAIIGLSILEQASLIDNATLDDLESDGWKL